MVKHRAVLANLLEIRGIGVIDVSKMFGISAILDKNDVDLIIQLERWVPSREYTRVGVEENDISEDVLGIKIPKSSFLFQVVEACRLLLKLPL